MIKPILIDLPEELTSENTLVRPYRMGDGQQLFEAVDESREHILPWMPWGPGHGSPNDSEELVRRFRSKWDLREDLGVFVADRATGRYVGGSGLHRIDWTVPSFEIGYWLRKSAVGRGHATSSVRILSHLAFDLLGAQRVFIRCAVENEASANVAKRAGFLFESRVRNAHRDALGSLHDGFVFSLIPDDWENLKRLKPVL